MRLRAAFSLFILASGCASTQGITPVTGLAGGSSRGPVPVYFALSPPFPYDVIGDLSVSLNGDQAHLENLLGEAETRARTVGADAIVIREARSEARTISQQIWRTCTSVGPGGRAYQYACPDVIQTLLVDGTLSAVAVRRRSAPRAGDTRWPPPPPLGSVGPAPAARGESSRDDLPSLDEVFSRP